MSDNMQHSVRNRGSSSFSPMRPYCQLLSLGPSVRRPSCCRWSSVPIREGRYQHSLALGGRICASASTSNLFKNLLDPKECTASSGTTAEKPSVRGWGTLGYISESGGGSYSDLDAGSASETEDGWWDARSNLATPS